jgi:hypothetical protein
LSVSGSFVKFASENEQNEKIVTMFFLKLNTMKKNLLWMMTAILFCGLSVFLTSCGDDDPQPKPAAVMVNRTYNVKLTVAETQGMPVKVGYYDAAGNIKVEQIQGTTWEKTVSYDVSKHCMVGFAHARMIEDVDYMEDDVKYAIGIDASGSVVTKFSDGSVQESVLTELDFLPYIATKVLGKGVKQKRDKGYNYYSFVSNVFEFNSGGSFRKASDADLFKAMGLQSGSSN